MPDTRTPEPVGWSGGFALHALVRSVPLRAATVPVSTAAPAEAHAGRFHLRDPRRIIRKGSWCRQQADSQTPVRRRAYDRRIARFIVIEKTMSRFLREPVSVSGAAATVVTATAVIVGASGVLMRLLDHREYPNVFAGCGGRCRR